MWFYFVVIEDLWKDIKNLCKIYAFYTGTQKDEYQHLQGDCQQMPKVKVFVFVAKRPPRNCGAVFSSVLGSAVLEELCHKQKSKLLNWIFRPIRLPPYMVLRTVDSSISIVWRLNATSQEEMHWAVLRIRSMNCFQTFRAQLSFLSLKFFKLIHSFLVILVLSMQCRSVIKLLQSVSLDNGTKARFMVFFLIFSPLPKFTGVNESHTQG